MSRFLFLDIPLLCIATIYCIITGVEWMGAHYFTPQLLLQQFTPDKAERDLTYFHRVCTGADQTTHTTADLVWDTSRPAEDAVDTMIRHGVVMVPHLLSPATAAPLRDFILNENQNPSTEFIHVISNQFRWSFPIQVDQHPIVGMALEEILNNEHLIYLLEDIVGPDPAVIEFTAITQAYGAKEQFWHQDGRLYAGLSL
jgi:hypothetical protein